MTRGDGSIASRLARAGVTEREAEVLSVVADRLRNREIAERLHVSVRTVESHVAALLRKLGATDRAALAELGAELRRTARADTALPAPLTSLVGRDRETSELAALLGTHRLVTLTGPAGVGKTRLALRAATAHAGTLPHGARLADLAPVAPELVGDTLARALGVVPQPGWPLREMLREAAGQMRCLLLVDNCEHVVAEAAELVAELLAAGGELRVLATSREPLGVPGEVSYQVRTLPVPTPQGSPRAATAGSFDAVRLFIDRAATAAPGFTLTDASAPAVAALCQRLDGLPLAIELAASRVRSFGPAELVAHLDERFALLAGGARTAPPRHRTLRGAIDWSYRLLDDRERVLFDQLGVFPADFDYPAVCAVCEADGGAVIELLPRLVDKSLVAPVGRATRRYRLLESIRAYAAERLAASGAEATTRERHAAHYLALAERARDGLRGPDQGAWLDRLAAEQPNLRTGLAHSIASGDRASAWRWIAALPRFWETTGQRREGYEWFRRTMAAGDPPATPAAVAGVVAASTLMHPSDARVSFDLAQQAARLASGLSDFARAQAALAVGIGAIWVRPEQVQPALQGALAGFGDDHPWERALTLQTLANTSTRLSDALGWGRESVALFRRLGDQIYAANTLFIMAQRSMHAGIVDDVVEQWLTESQALVEAAGSEDDRVHATVGFGQLAWLRGEHDRAARLMEHCLPTLRRVGDRRCTGRALYVLGEHAREQGHLAHAEGQLHGSVAAVALAGQSVVLVSALESLAAVRLARGRPRDAAVLLGAAHAQRESASPHQRTAQAPEEELRRSLVQAQGAEAFDAAFSEGQRLSPTKALEAGRSTPPA